MGSGLRCGKCRVRPLKVSSWAGRSEKHPGLRHSTSWHARQADNDPNTLHSLMSASRMSTYSPCRNSKGQGMQNFCVCNSSLHRSAQVPQMCCTTAHIHHPSIHPPAHPYTAPTTHLARPLLQQAGVDVARLGVVRHSLHFLTRHIHNVGFTLQGRQAGGRSLSCHAASASPQRHDNMYNAAVACTQQGPSDRNIMRQQHVMRALCQPHAS